MRGGPPFGQSGPAGAGHGGDSPARGRGRGEDSGVISRAPVVDVRSLHVRFGEVEAVAGVDLAAYAGHSTALLGRNGAGKSTTMRVLAGVVPPTAGSAVVAGHDVRTHALDVKRAVGYCPDVGGLVPRAT